METTFLSLVRIIEDNQCPFNQRFKPIYLMLHVFIIRDLINGLQGIGYSLMETFTKLVDLS